jgi:RNA polymerase sigma-70 factor (ECF subfamily)
MSESAADIWDSLWEAARMRWPEVDVSLQDFRRFVEARQEEEAGALPTSEIAAELYLACACLAGDARALAAIEEKIRQDVRPTVLRLGRRGPALEDALQAVRARLLAGESPKLGGYKGRGGLSAFLRVVAVRTVLNLGKERTELADDEAALGLIDERASPELALMKATYAAEFRKALAEAAASLDARERALLRLAFIERLNVDALGELHGVHRATAARWVQHAHEKLAAATRKALRERLAVSATEYDSIVRMIASGFETSLGRYLE